MFVAYTHSLTFATASRRSHLLISAGHTHNHVQAHPALYAKDSFLRVDRLLQPTSCHYEPYARWRIIW